MINIRLKVADLNDAETIYLIDQNYEHDNYSLDMIKQSICNENSINIIAYLEDKPIAYISYVFSYDEAELIKIVVLKEYRKSGIGVNLITYSLDVLKEKGVCNIFLEVRESNVVAKKLYDKIGFNKIYSRKKYYKDGEDADIYRLSIE